MHTWGVQLPLLQESFIDDEGSVVGQLEEATDQAVGCVVFVGNEFQVVHVLYSHLQTKGLQGKCFNKQGWKFPHFKKICIWSRNIFR